MVRKLVVDVPDNLKADFKVYCMKNGTSIHEQIVEFMQGALDGTTKETNGMESVEQTEGSPVQAAAPAAQVSPLQLKKAVEFDVRAFRNALNLTEEKKEETTSFSIDALDIGL